MLNILIIHLPIVLGRNVTITEMPGASFLFGRKRRRRLFDFLGMRFSPNAFSFGASDRDDQIVIRKVEMRKVKLTERAEEFAKGFWKNLEPASADIGVIKPVNSPFAVLRSVNRGVRVHMVELKEDFLGAAWRREPIANKCYPR